MVFAKALWLSMLGAGLLGSQPSLETQATADPVLSKAIAFAKEKAFKAPSVDWPAVEAEATAKWLAAPGEDGRTAAIRHVLGALKDGHSSYRPPDTYKSDPGAMRHSPAEPIARADVAEGRFGRLVINGWSGDSSQVPAATALVRNELRKAMSIGSCGLIVDVATNSGGNMWPMMGGLAPLYEEGTLETFEGRDGTIIVNVRNGLLRKNDHVYPLVEALPKLDAKPKFVAIIIGRKTASSGEILALGFKHQANARSFGRATAGATTANSSIRLPNGGLLAITSSRIRDRAGAVQHGPLVPDELSEQPLHAAQDWLAERCE
ncbi:C-terminal processing protease CtpA/Prc [Lysobacter niastensis]|uniref:C-terminal processing protease CtpA/Prc n=1 Tax=Lysobacter niastensis TaxID=380629 RepID=A0ABU1W6X8_9GAMM|nr:S41 family peptidase [Lysobacter niastensis]MDR7133110.1 C-terminal processing protease CtpA/Prc [Lysobacter niastensis]